MSEPLDIDARTPSAPSKIPSAGSAPARRLSAAWLLPLLALVFAVYTGWRAWAERGPLIAVLVRDGHGIQVGDPLRYRGIQVGEIEGLTLSDELTEVQLEVRLLPAAGPLAREGSRFWLVRPELSLEGVRGLETILGANYLAVQPGPHDAPRARDFVALERPPIGEELEPEGLFLVLEASARFGLAPGAPISYRDFQIGTVTAVRLASDARVVEVDAYIRPDYRRLVREDSRFFETGGVEIDLALTQGLHVDIGSLRTLLVGGIALATPTQPGAAVESGQRFSLHAEEEDDWAEWRPSLPVGRATPGEAELPTPLASSITWRPRGILGREQRREGWMWMVGQRAIGPRDLVDPGEEVREGELAISIGGRPVEAGASDTEAFGGLARVALSEPAGRSFAPERVELEPRIGDWLLLGPAGEPPQAVAAGRLTEAENGWQVLGGSGFGPRWHGAAVIARESGQLVGILLANDDRAHIARIPAAWAASE